VAAVGVPIAVPSAASPVALRKLRRVPETPVLNSEPMNPDPFLARAHPLKAKG
jgi:hypothetical protein